MDNLGRRPFCAGATRRVTSIRLGALAIAAFCASFALDTASSAAPPPGLEQAVKASFLFKFAPFVEWPANVFPSSARSFVICLSGDDPFGPVLDEVVRGQRISGRAVNVRRLGVSGNALGCHMLFAGKSGDTAYTPFAEVAGKPVLTVADRTGGPSGAMIQFVMQGGRVRFQIDDATARANGLNISSKLLGLATSVERK